MSTTTTNSGPGYAKNPEHKIRLERPSSRVQVVLQSGETVADTTNAIALYEASYPVVYYVPRADVKMNELVRTDHKSHCPFKGDASYFSLKDGAANAVWSYETPFDEVIDIKEYLAFYPSKVGAINVTRDVT